VLATLSASRDLTAWLGPGWSSSGPALYVAAPAVLRALVGFPFHRGCLALAERGVAPPVAALIEPTGPRTLVLLDDLADPDNVGGVFRNALAFGVDAVLLSGGCADPLYRKAIRTSAAATLALPFARVADWPAALADVRRAGYRLIALTPEAGAVDVGALERPECRAERQAVLLGAEGRGLAPVSRAAADLKIGIRMAAGVDSLNVATASGIALHQLTRPAAPPRSA
jgi:tRNA G18 (ribose-2'-O)-methylase SpoU